MNNPQCNFLEFRVRSSQLQRHIEFSMAWVNDEKKKNDLIFMGIPDSCCIEGYAVIYNQALG